MKRLGLDRVWWLVTPGNPLKDTRGLAAARANASRPRARSPHHPRIDVTGLEAAHRHPLHLRDRRVSAPRAARACISSGSWAPTICAASIAGRTGAASPPWCRSRWSTGSGRAFTPPAASPAQALARCPHSRDARRSSLPDRAAAGLGLPARAEIAAVVDRAAARKTSESDAKAHVMIATGVRLKPLTGVPILRCPASSGAMMQRKERNPVHTCTLSGQRPSRARTGLQGAS